MAARRIEAALIFFIIKNAILDTGIVDDVYENTKFYCAGDSKYAFIVSSQIQCIHRCLQKKCFFLNYKNGESRAENCEVFARSSHCSDAIHKKRWIAMQIQVSHKILAISPDWKI